MPTPTIFDRALARPHFTGDNWPEVCRRLGPPWVDGRGRVSDNSQSARKALLREMGRGDGHAPAPAAAAPPPTWAAEGGEHPAIPPSPEARSDEYPRLEGDYLVLFDPHLPLHDKALLDEACERAARLGVKRFLIGGDLFNHPQFGRHDRDKAQERRWQDDVEIGDRVMEALCARFPGPNHVIMGNHCRWLFDALRGQADVSWLWSRILQGAGERVTFTDHEMCQVTSGGERFFVAHGANYSSVNPLGVAKRLAGIHHMHVVIGHQHMAEQGRDASGRYQVICGGGVFDPARMRYANLVAKTLPRMQQGYVIIKGGYAKLFEPHADRRSW